MMSQKLEKKTLSKSILEMKFMKKSKEKYINEQNEMEGRAMFASEVTEAMRVGGNKFIIEPSYVPCEGLLGGRLSYHGMNPEIEKLSENEKLKKEANENNDMEISDLEMARRYTTLIGTISNKFKSKNKKWSSTDQPPEKRAKFMKPKDGDDVSPNIRIVTMPTYYEILGCDKSASYEEIKQCYYNKVKKCHPDKSTDKCEEEFYALDRAWKTLRNVDRRREYDLEIGKKDMNEMPLYCELGLSDMSFDLNTDTYSYACRCGGLYVVNKSELCDFDRFKISCEECTFYIDLFLNK